MHAVPCLITQAKDGIVMSTDRFNLIAYTACHSGPRAGIHFLTTHLDPRLRGNDLKGDYALF